jgi:hypothetical protein
MNKCITFLLVSSLISCGTRFDIHGVDHEKLLRDANTTSLNNDVSKEEKELEESSGCMKDTDCEPNEVCATVKGELPGSCAQIGGDGLLLGAAILGAAAAAAAMSSSSGSQSSSSQSDYNSYAPRCNLFDVYVRPHYRSDGSFVPGHCRSRPDSIKSNNYGRKSSWSRGLYDRDVDGDGILNQYDPDDDNDGVPDDYE